MSISRIGHRYVDSESKKTIDTWFPSGNQQINRSCDLPPAAIPISWIEVQRFAG